MISSGEVDAGEVDAVRATSANSKANGALGSKSAGVLDLSNGEILQSEPRAVDTARSDASKTTDTSSSSVRQAVHGPSITVHMDLSGSPKAADAPTAALDSSNGHSVVDPPDSVHASKPIGAPGSAQAGDTSNGQSLQIKSDALHLIGSSYISADETYNEEPKTRLKDVSEGMLFNNQIVGYKKKYLISGCKKSRY